MKSTEELKSEAKLVRKMVLQMAHDAKTSHVSPALSCVDILVALYSKFDESEDHFIMSKGHAVSALYALLALRGKIPKEWISMYCKNGGQLYEHPSCHVPCIELSTGSLGHGLSVAAGIALAKQLKHEKGKVFVLLGDGECNEGSVWEAAMFAASKGLRNLVVIVDKNNFQATGKCDDVMHLDLVNIWKSFGWNILNVDGHKMDYLEEFPYFNPFDNCAPLVIIANTIKGKGVSFMENNLLWHYKSPSDLELEAALKEIDNA